MSTPFVYDEIYRCIVTKKQCELVQKYEYSGSTFREDKFKVETVEVPATDSKKIPLTIIGPKRNKMQKLLLTFYGCYGLPTRIPYDNVGLAALEKGWTLCYAHIRGGS